MFVKQMNSMDNGSAAVVFARDVKLRLISNDPLMSSRSNLPSPWNMNKESVRAELRQREITFHQSWTVPELRTVLMEARAQDPNCKKAENHMKGISKLSLEDLIKLAQEAKLELPPKPTRGWLLLALRQARSTPEETVVPFGKFKGWMYREIPQGYLSWAIAEVASVGEAVSHPDLVRLASWAKENMELKQETLQKMNQLKKDPEATAKTPVPKLSEMGYRSSGSEWSRVTSTSMPRNRPRHTQQDVEELSSDMEENETGVAEQIEALEKRLAALKKKPNNA